MSTTTRASYGQPALIGGLVLGVLSALPFVAAGNFCCCLWVVSGGLVAAYMLQQNQMAPITPGDGALVGLLAGLIGAGVQFALSLPLDWLLGPMERTMLLRFIERMPPDMRDAIEQATRGTEARSFFIFVIFHFVRFIVFAFIAAIFSTLGGLLGATIFKKSPPPPGTIDVPAVP